ncbi:hypothetical protein RZS08_10650, partial [Arthrospira platensis SPKY1]|nr:hypothetical protein [Arthrospira platensis SPKY1]
MIASFLGEAGDGSPAAPQQRPVGQPPTGLPQQLGSLAPQLAPQADLSGQVLQARIVRPLSLALLEASQPGVVDVRQGRLEDTHQLCLQGLLQRVKPVPDRLQALPNPLSGFRGRIGRQGVGPLRRRRRGLDQVQCALGGCQSQFGHASFGLVEAGPDFLQLRQVVGLA